MISFRNQERVENRVEIAHRSLELIAKETRVMVGAGRFGFEITYRRPSSIRLGSDGSRVPIRDHVMIVRLTAVAIPLLLSARRFINA